MCSKIRDSQLENGAKNLIRKVLNGFFRSFVTLHQGQYLATWILSNVPKEIGSDHKYTYIYDSLSKRDNSTTWNFRRAKVATFAAKQCSQIKSNSASSVVSVQRFALWSIFEIRRCTAHGKTAWNRDLAPKISVDSKNRHECGTNPNGFGVAARRQTIRQ